MPSRLTLALDHQLLQLPSEVAFAVLNATPGDDFGGVATSRIIAQQQYFPYVEALRSRGIETKTEISNPVATTLVSCHRSKATTHSLIAQAIGMTEIGGLVLVDGDKTAGIESIAKDLRKRLSLVDVYSKSHGKLLWFIRGADTPDLSDWIARPATVESFTTFPGIFSADKIDKGSELLTQHLPTLKGRVADLGAGWGYLSHFILQSDTVSELDLIEADATALSAAKLNITDPRASFHWADATDFGLNWYDVIVTNPPFHTSRIAEPALGQAFISASARALKPSGSFWMVANRNLPYEETLAAEFGNVRLVTQENGFKVFHARKPKTSRTR